MTSDFQYDNLDLRARLALLIAAVNRADIPERDRLWILPSLSVVVGLECASDSSVRRARFLGSAGLCLPGYSTGRFRLQASAIQAEEESAVSPREHGAETTTSDYKAKKEQVTPW